MVTSTAAPVRMLRSAAVGALRVAFTVVGVWLGGVAPVKAAVDARRVANAASGHVPNMDPGVLLVVAMMLATVVAAMALLAELLRCWAFGGAPLKVPSHALLGMVAASPIGLSLTLERFRMTGPVVIVLVVAGVVLLLFYAAMGLRSLRRRARLVESGLDEI